MQICQSLSIKDHRKLTFHRQFIMNNFTLGTIFFGLALIMGQLPGNSGSQPESGSEEREMYEKYGKYPKFELPDDHHHGRVQSLRSQSESGDEGDMDFYIAMDQFCKKSGNDLRWQGRHLCIKV